METKTGLEISSNFGLGSCSIILETYIRYSEWNSLIFGDWSKFGLGLLTKLSIDSFLRCSVTLGTAVLFFLGGYSTKFSP